MILSLASAQAFHVGLYSPAVALEYAGRPADEHPGCASVSFEHPVEPCQGDYAELSAVGLAVGAAMSDGIVHRYGHYVVDPVEVVHAVLIGDVLGTAEQVEHGGVDVVQALLDRHRHAGYGSGRVDEEPAVADHNGPEPRIGGVVEGLESSARHSCRGDVPEVKLVEIGAGRI